MKRDEAVNLNAALMAQGLKVKYLTSTSYADLLELKRPLQRYISEMSEDELSLAKDMDIPLRENGFSTNDKSFIEKLRVIQGKEFAPNKLNFIPIEEFKKFTDELDFGVSSILAEYLLTK